MAKITAKQVLDCPMGRNDANAQTVRDYLKALLAALWDEGEGFSGKRPFGNSGWEHDLQSALVTGGLLSGGVDQYGAVVEVDAAKSHRLIDAAIKELW